MAKEETLQKLKTAQLWSTRIKNFLGTIDYATGAVAVGGLMSAMVLLWMKGTGAGKDSYDYISDGDDYGTWAGNLLALFFSQRFIAGLVDGAAYGGDYTLRFKDLQPNLQQEVRALLESAENKSDDDVESGHEALIIKDTDSVESLIAHISQISIPHERDDDDDDKACGLDVGCATAACGAGTIGGVAAGVAIWNGEVTDKTMSVMLASGVVLAGQGLYGAGMFVRAGAEIFAAHPVAITQSLATATKNGVVSLYHNLCAPHATTINPAPLLRETELNTAGMDATAYRN